MNKLVRTSAVAGFFSAAVILSVGLAPTASAAVQAGTTQLVDANGMCLGSWLGRTDTQAIQWDCNTNNDQEWSFQWMGSDSGWGSYYRITNNDGQCLGINGASTASGAYGTVWDCNGNNDQLWYYQQGSNGWGGLVNRNSKMCLGSQDGSNQPGAWQIQWSCNGNNDQLWKQKTW